MSRIEEILDDLRKEIRVGKREPLKERKRLILPPLPEVDLLNMPVTQLPERCWKKLN